MTVLAFPATPLDVEVSLALSADLSDPGSWVWTDITAYVREDRRIRIRRGRSSERSTIPPSRCTLTVDNTDGRFCRFLPTGAWYGQIGPNTPIRVRVNNGSGYVTRFVGYVSGWPPTWDPSERDQTVTITADGILRRLGQGRVLRSALYRAITTDALAPLAYWPLEDGGDVTTFAAYTAGTAAATGALYLGTNSPADPAGCTSIPGSAPCAQLPIGAILDFTVPDHTSSGTWATHVAIHEDEGTTQFGWNMRSVPDNVSLTVLIYPGTPLFMVGAVNIATGATIFSNTDTIVATDTVGVPASLIVGCSGAAGGTTVVRLLDGNGNTIATTTNTGTGVSMTPRTLSASCVAVVGGGSVGVGHVVYYNDASFNIATGGVDLARSTGGWPGEMAHERVDRLCAEEGVPVTVTATTSQAMGPQRSNTLVALLRECATTDFGLLYEPADAAGLAFLSSSERYNLDPAIVLEYDQGQIAPPWDPTDDDRDTRNDVTASRPGGSSARVTDETSIAAIGVYDDTLSANTESDDQLNDIAAWAVNLGTVDELRWPAVKPNLLKHPSLIDDWLTADLGSWLAVTGHPSPLAPDDIEQIIEGYDEVFGSYEFSVTANLSPASGWRVAELDDDDLGKLDTDGSVLVAAVNSSATSLTVATTTLDSPLWTTDAGEMPIPILVAGEVMNVTAVENAAGDTWTRTVSPGWGTSTGGQVWSSSDAVFSANGSTGRSTHAASGIVINTLGSTTGYGATTAVVKIQIGQKLTGAGAMFPSLLLHLQDSSNYRQFGLYYQASGTPTGSVGVVMGVTTGGSFNNLFSNFSFDVYNGSEAFWLKAEAVGSIMRFKVWRTTVTEPGGWTAQVTDATFSGGSVAVHTSKDGGITNVSPFVTWDDLSVTNPQKFTVTRSVNGVAKSQSALAVVRDLRGLRLAL